MWAAGRPAQSQSEAWVLASLTARRQQLVSCWPAVSVQPRLVLGMEGSRTGSEIWVTGPPSLLYSTTHVPRLALPPSEPSFLQAMEVAQASHSNCLTPGWGGWERWGEGRGQSRRSSQLPKIAPK